MIATQKNIIQTVSFDVQVTDEATAASFADKLRTVNCEALFDKVLCKYENAPQTIRLDKVELDIGTIELDDMDLLDEKIMLQLEEILNKRIVASKESDRKKIKPGKDQRKPAVQEVDHTIEVLLYYLNTGTLPWNIINKPDMEQLFLQLLEEDVEKVKRALLPEFKKMAVTRRMATIFSYSTIQLFIEKIIAAEELLETEKIVSILESKIPSSEIKEFKQHLAMIYLTAAFRVAEQQKIFSEVFGKMLLPVLQLFTCRLLQAIYVFIEEQLKLVADRRLGSLYRNVLKLIKEAMSKKDPSSLAEIEAKQNQENSKEESASKQNQQNLKEEAASKEKDGKSRKDAEQEAETLHEQEDGSLAEDNEADFYFIDNAGLVLLNAALLQRCFEQMGWVSEKKIVNEIARHKMMLWMDYLVWGHRKIQEYGLTLNKLLVGLHPTDLADINVSLTEDEQRVADEILQTVVEYWTILKNTSTESLRNTFLQRNGKLGNEDGGWQMHVESKGYDILIESLPWSFSIIKYPWMQKPLFTQWLTRI